MGEKTEAFEFLEVAYQQPGSWLIFLDTLPNLRNIRSEPRYSRGVHRAPACDGVRDRRSNRIHKRDIAAE